MWKDVRKDTSDGDLLQQMPFVIRIVSKANNVVTDLTAIKFTSIKDAIIFIKCQTRSGLAISLRYIYNWKLFQLHRHLPKSLKHSRPK